LSNRSPHYRDCTRLSRKDKLFDHPSLFGRQGSCRASCCGHSIEGACGRRGRGSSCRCLEAPGLTQRTHRSGRTRTAQRTTCRSHTAHTGHTCMLMRASSSVGISCSGSRGGAQGVSAGRPPAARRRKQQCQLWLESRWLAERMPGSGLAVLDARLTVA